jgi:hypothetical protein
MSLTGCEEDRSWNWQYGYCAVNGPTLQFKVSEYTLTYPNGWISTDCNPSLNQTAPIDDLLVFPSWVALGSGSSVTLNLTIPQSWQSDPSFDVPNPTLTRTGNVATWSLWDTLGGYGVDVAVSSWAEGRLDVFVIGADGAMYHNAWNDSDWSDWGNLGGACISAAAGVSWGLNRIDTFVIGPDHALYHQWWDGSRWSGWAENLGGYCQNGVAAVSIGPQPA